MRLSFSRPSTVPVMVRLGRPCLGIAAAIAATFLALPAQASTAFCAAFNPTSTGCTAVATNQYIGNDTFLYSFDGTFLADDNVQIFMVTVPGDLFLTLDTFSYGGGPDLGGAAVAQGGFATAINLFAGNGNFINNSFFDTCGPNANYNTTTGECYDASLGMFVTAGTYYVALTENYNYANGGNLFSSPNVVNIGAFSQGGTGNFTASGGCSAFCDPFGDTMNGSYYADVAFTTPEPGSFSLVSISLAGGFLLWRRRRRASAV